jgi:predicted dehydrogenase/threonine dehydrogenase-like Zn-dependent dehydrogenase
LLKKEEFNGFWNYSKGSTRHPAVLFDSFDCTLNVRIPMQQIIVRKGQVKVESVPAPNVEPGTVLVAVNYSCISVGTELSGIKSGAKPLWKKALDQPDKVKKAINMALTQGLSKTKDQVLNVLSTGRPTGYSLAGTVVEVGRAIHDIKPGDRVACAGAQCAHHAEVVRVPRNLVVPVPGDIGLAEASTVTLGAIAMQGVRRLNPTLGECFVVIGLGILGQLSVQLLKANGCRVIGVDLDQGRVDLACSLGLDIGLDAQIGNQVDQVNRLTGGIGADGVIVTAATPSSEPLSTAFKMCRKKARVVLVGDVGLDINRADIYAKELDFFISTSYGPGRYDEKYEEHGRDYPVSYVRWTENRNMEEYLRLLSEGRVNVKSLISATYPITDAPKAYSDLQKPGAKPLVTLLSYPELKAEIDRRIDINPSTKRTAGIVRMAVVGAGGFARSTHLPNLKKLSNLYKIRAICSRTGHSAKSVGKQFGANYATTDFDQILADPEVDAVLIATRHHLHAEMTLKALKAGKHVLVEKPLCLTREELKQIEEFFQQKQSLPVLLTGFNRRFSPHIKRIKEIMDKRTNPMIINYRMNAGYIPLDHWVHGPEGGGRNIGEACHIYDLFTFLTNAKLTQLNANSIHPQTGYYSSRDNFICTAAFEDGSIATLLYTALGAKAYPKEKMEIYVDGQVLFMDDYKRVEIIGSRENGITTKAVDKGLEEELRLFGKTILVETPQPNPLWQQMQAMEMALMANERLS